MSGLQNFLVDGCSAYNGENIKRLAGDYGYNERVLHEATNIRLCVSVEAESYEEAIEKLFCDFYRYVDETLGDIPHYILYNREVFMVYILTDDERFLILKFEDIACYRQ